MILGDGFNDNTSQVEKDKSKSSSDPKLDLKREINILSHKVIECMDYTDNDAEFNFALGQLYSSILKYIKVM